MDASFVFNVVVAYEDFNAAKRAAKMVERLQSQLYPAIQIAAESWKFELIGDSRLRALATDAADHAEMLILALTDDGELPFYLKQWLEAWALFEHGEPRALVMLHDFSSADIEWLPLRAYLQGVAEKGNLDLFLYGEGAIIGRSTDDNLTVPVVPYLVPCNGRTTTLHSQLATR
jgi:hypothetical protein